MPNNKKRGGTPPPLTLLIRFLIIAIFVVAVVITVMRIAEINQNDRKADELMGEQARVAAVTRQI